MRITLLLLFLTIYVNLSAQEGTPPDRLQYHISIGQYPASIGVPTFSALHPGVNTGVIMRWNNHVKHQILQSGNIGYFYHKDLQKSVQLFTELGYNMKFGSGLAIMPLAFGGGYAMSISDLNTLEWNATTKQYETKNNAIRHNFLISIGASMSWETNVILIHNRKTTFFVDYRVQVQGIFVKETVPVIAYTPVRVGVSFPFKENIRGYMHKKSFF